MDGGTEAVTNERASQAPAASTECRSCGSPWATSFATGDGPVRLCPGCAVMHDLGCP